MNAKELSVLINREEWECTMLIRMIPEGIMPKEGVKTQDDSLILLLGQLKDICFEHTPSTPYDDDEHWYARSPFNGKRYHFAAVASAGAWPCFIEAK